MFTSGYVNKRVVFYFLYKKEYIPQLNAND